MSCNYNILATTKSMSLAETFDGGKTWSKPNYPNNRILTDAQSGYAANIKEKGVGDGKFLIIGNYIYVVFYAASDSAGPSIARSKVSDQGKPGTWLKYYCTDSSNKSTCSFSEPGIGGKSTRFVDNSYIPINKNITYNSYVDRYISISHFGSTGSVLNFSLTNDILGDWKWSEEIYPMTAEWNTPESQNWIRTPQGRYLFDYVSLVNIDGDSSKTGKEFYVYYMKIYPGEDWTKRYLYRRKVTLHKENLTGQFANIALTLYKSGNQYRASTDRVQVSKGYGYVENLGYISPHPVPNFISLYECYYKPGDIYGVNTSLTTDPKRYNWNTCSDSPDDIYLKRIGYISPTKTKTANIAIYRCRNTINSSYFLYNKEDCLGQKKESLVGYAFGSKSGKELDQNPVSRPSTIIVENEGTGYQESGPGWNTSTFTGAGYNNSSSRYSCENGSSLKYTPNLSSGGLYRISIFKIAYPNSDSKAKIQIISDGKELPNESAIKVNLGAVNFQDKSGWFEIGDYTLPAGTSSYVQVSRGDLCLRGDAVKFIQINK